MKKAVFFPGTGYTCKEDLFQRIGQGLGQAGWSVVPLDWQVIPFKDIDTIAEACDMAVGFAICALEGEGLEDCDDLLFVSKSLGCISALEYSQLFDLEARHVLLTPTPDALALVKTSTEVACAVIGDEDPLMDSSSLVSFGEKHGFPVFVVKGTGHALKYDDPLITEIITSRLVSFVNKELGLHA